MKITEVKNLAIPEVKVITYERFRDVRGYFTETFRRSDFENREDLAFFRSLKFFQSNESHSKKNVFRGLHFQWNPYMGKLIRVIQGQMIDFALDIRIGSPTFGHMVGYKMQSSPKDTTASWVWVPVGFAHGVFFLEESTIEYYCTGEWNPQCEASITPLDSGINWSLCEKEIAQLFHKEKKNIVLSEKDKNGYTLSDWQKSDKTKLFP